MSFENCFLFNYFWCRKGRKLIFCTIVFLFSRRDETYKAWTWKVNFKIWPQVKVIWWLKLTQTGHIAYHQCAWVWQRLWAHSHVCISLQSKVISKKRLVTFGDLTWTFSGVAAPHLHLGYHEWPKRTRPWKHSADLMRILGMGRISTFPHWHIPSPPGLLTNPECLGGLSRPPPPCCLTNRWS